MTLTDWDILYDEMEAAIKATNSYKEKLIAAALSTDEGRRALAEAMVEPLRRSLNSTSWIRPIFGVP